MKKICKKVLYVVMCSSLVLGLVGCAADGGLSVRRDNSFSAVSEALQKGIEAETDKNTPKNDADRNSDTSSETGMVSKSTDFDNKAEGEIFYNGDEWLDPAFENGTIDLSQDDLRMEEKDGNGLDLSESSASADGIDIDLTQMSATMVYAEVYNIMCYPDRYIGKTIKADGEFATYLDETTGKMYYACIVKDATACCAQGLEFAPYDERKYPDDFPAEGDEVCVIGEFDTYMEGEDKFGVLKNAKMIYG